MVKRHCRSFFLLEISPTLLLFLQCFKQRLEISFPETLRAFALDDFEEQRRSVLHRLRKYLEQITFVIAVDQKPEPLQRPQVFVNVTDSLGKRVVISGRNVQEFEAAL